MSDLISRQAAIERIEAEYQAWGDEYDVRQILGDLEDLPSAQPLDPCETCLHKGKGWDEDPCDGCTGAESKYEPGRQRGKWYRAVLCSTSGYGTTVMYQCSNCENMAISEYRFCHNCGSYNGGE